MLNFNPDWAARREEGKETKGMGMDLWVPNQKRDLGGDDELMDSPHSPRLIILCGLD